MPVFWLPENSYSFPNPSLANEDGILAIGGDLSADRIINAYELGIFPWFNPDDPIIWWSPNPRFVLFPDELKIAKSMRPYFNNNRFQITADQAFEEVMRQCQTAKRNGQAGGTWITEKMIEGYVAIHEKGLAHSVEVWQDGELVGGLYGVCLGKCFFGESMFTKASNASKFGFISLVQTLREQDFELVDCQQPTRHLKTLGARSIPRTEFLERLAANKRHERIAEDWSTWFE
ncbi:MAG: leucyl/phenylalanyl-tRNA--protein transferase [Bacteroidota bacterium]